MNRICLLMAAVIAVAASSSAWAWGPTAHRITGALAATYLDKTAEAVLQDLLEGRSLADITTWADEIRRDPTYDWVKPLHYINVPREATRLDLKRDCGNDECIVAAIEKYAAVLRNREAPRAQRIEALKLLVHFVGDVHQPLHVSYYDDRGGNFIKVSWMGEGNWNLHRVWDDGLVRQWTNRDEDAAVKKLRNRLSVRELNKYRRSLNPADWANESLQITRRIYRELPGNGQLDDAYYRRNIASVEQQLAAAGVRMGAMLNDILGEGAGAAKPKQPRGKTPTSTQPATQPAAEPDHDAPASEGEGAPGPDAAPQEAQAGG